MNPMWEELAKKPSGFPGQTDWPPIMCPQCWAMRFIANDRMAQCYYCGYVMMRLEK